MSMCPQKARKKYDVLIIGAGPSGTTLGYLLCEAGMRVLVIDKMKFPRPKLCAGAMTRKTRRLVENIFKVSFDKQFVVKNISQEYDEKLVDLVEEKSCSFLFDHQVVDIDLTNNTVLTKPGEYLQGEIVVGAYSQVVFRFFTQRLRMALPLPKQLCLGGSWAVSISVDLMKHTECDNLQKIDFLPTLF